MDPARNEDCRNEALAYLATRQGVKQTSSTILRRLNRENDFGEGEVVAALTFLVGQGLVESEPDTLGSTRYYGATSAGVLHYERNL